MLNNPEYERPQQDLGELDLSIFGEDIRDLPYATLRALRASGYNQLPNRGIFLRDLVNEESIETWKDLFSVCGFDFDNMRSSLSETATTDAFVLEGSEGLSLQEENELLFNKASELRSSHVDLEQVVLDRGNLVDYIVAFRKLVALDMHTSGFKQFIRTSDIPPNINSGELIIKFDGRKFSPIDESKYPKYTVAVIALGSKSIRTVLAPMVFRAKDKSQEFGILDQTIAEDTATEE